MCWDVKPLPVAVKKPKKYDYLVDSTHLKNNISQIGNLPQVGVKIRNLWNHLDDDISGQMTLIPKREWSILEGGLPDAIPLLKGDRGWSCYNLPRRV